jgi:hypothetical protein
LPLTIFSTPNVIRNLGIEERGALETLLTIPSKLVLHPSEEKLVVAQTFVLEREMKKANIPNLIELNGELA